MRRWECSCGKTTVTGFSPPDPCHACSDCGSNLGWNAGARVIFVPHSMILTDVHMMTDEGVQKGKLTLCRLCGKTKAVIEKIGQKMEEYKPEIQK